MSVKMAQNLLQIFLFRGVYFSPQDNAFKYEQVIPNIAEHVAFLHFFLFFGCPHQLTKLRRWANLWETATPFITRYYSI